MCCDTYGLQTQTKKRVGTLTKTPDCCTYVLVATGPMDLHPMASSPMALHPTYLYTADMGSRPNREIPYPGVQAREFYPRGRDLGDIKRLVLKRARIRTYVRNRYVCTYVRTYMWAHPGGNSYVRTVRVRTYLPSRIRDTGAYVCTYVRTYPRTYVRTFLWALRVPFAGASIPGGQISWHRFGTWGCTYRLKPT